MAQKTFSELVLELAQQIPPGRVATYGQLARAAGGGNMAARSVTGILAKASNQHTIPFHRIVYANGRVWFSSEYEAKRRRLYKKEGIELDAQDRIKNFADVAMNEEDWKKVRKQTSK